MADNDNTPTPTPTPTVWLLTCTDEEERGTEAILSVEVYSTHELATEGFRRDIEDGQFAFDEQEVVMALEEMAATNSWLMGGITYTIEPKVIDEQPTHR